MIEKRTGARRRRERRKAKPGSTTRYEDHLTGYVPKRIRQAELRKLRQSEGPETLI